MARGDGPKHRLRIFRSLAASRHRYEVARGLTQSVSLLILFAVPMTGLAQVDLAGGRHRLWFGPAPFRVALAGVIGAIGLLYVVTFLSNLAGARLFCGWGCPVGQLSRFGETVDRPGQSRGQVSLATLRGSSFSLVLVLSMLAWWIDPTVLIRSGSPHQKAAWALVALGMAAAYGHGRFWRWSFCKSACPIGLYYSFVSPARWFGIHFRNESATCLECDLCDRVCPVDLKPRDLMAPVEARAGISIADAPGRNHCLECGDCVRACEWIIELRGKDPVPLRLGYFRGDQRREASLQDEGITATSAAKGAVGGSGSYAIRKAS